MTVVVPARNEEIAIGRCLGALLAAPVDQPLQVVVVANGCSDMTADRARAFAPRAAELGVQLDVIEEDLKIPSKVGALNVGEQKAIYATRAYLDADILLSPGALGVMAQALQQPGVHLVSPRVVMAPTGRHFADSYAQIWMHSPAVTKRVVGAGFYAVSASGRARWDGWPELISDDKFVRLHFGEHEQRVVGDASMTLSMPTDFGEMIRTRGRWCRGNRQLADGFPDLDSRDRRLHYMFETLIEIARRPGLWRHAPAGAFVYVTGWLLALVGGPGTTWTSPRSSPIRDLRTGRAAKEEHERPGDQRAIRRTTLRIALIGTRGVPARYGGFETAVEEIGTRLAARGHDVTVYCRGGDPHLTSYLGMRLVHLPAIRHKIAETISHTALSVIHRRALSADVALLFNAANAPLLPVLRAARVPTALHVDGLEWKRSKWSGAGRRYYLANERLGVRWADALIADALGIQDYYRDVYRAESVFIPYGAPILTAPALHRLGELGLTAEQYHLVVARFEPENHVHLAIQGYVTSGVQRPLVIVGTAPYADAYIAQIQRLATSQAGVRMLGGVWDQDLLDALYAGCLTYVHGHSVGGTNPSLLRAMGAAAPVLAFDVNFNREVAGETGRYWKDPQELAKLLVGAEADPLRHHERGRAGQFRAASTYTWDAVTNDYEALSLDLARRRVTRRWRQPTNGGDRARDEEAGSPCH
jgi:glycosyltransferase involved in cell wall biosynthesis